MRGQLLELGFVKGRKVPAARVFRQSVVTPRNVDSGHVKIVESRKNKQTNKQTNKLELSDVSMLLTSLSR